MQKHKIFTKKALFFAFLTLTISFGSIFRVQAIVGFQIFDGTVVDSTTGFPISNVKVTVYQSSTIYDTCYTNDNGEYSLIVGPLTGNISCC